MIVLFTNYIKIKVYDMNNVEKKKKLLILGGNQISCEIVRKAKEMGCFTVVTDYHPVEKSPCKRIADAAYDISVTDVEAIVLLIKQEKIDGVITGFADWSLPYYADICKKAGLPAYGTKEQFEIFTDKKRYKALMRSYHVPTVDDYVIDADNLEAAAGQIRYPVLVKPADACGARGITVCYSKENLREAVQKAKGFSAQGHLLFERYMEGREVTVFWIFQDGNYYLSAVGNRHVKHNQEGVIPLPVGYTYPSVFLNRYRKDVEDNCKRMFRAIGIKNGMMFMQCKVERGSCFVYDIGYRLTGSLEYKNIEDTCGYNPLELMIYFALHGKMSEQDIGQKADPSFGGRYGFNVSCLSAPGMIGKLLGTKTVMGFPEVIDAVIDHYPGEMITESMKGLLSQITIRILGTVDREEELYDIMHKIEQAIHIISAEGEELRLPGIASEDVKGYVLHKSEHVTKGGMI